MNDEKFLCLKNTGSTASVSLVTLLIEKASPSGVQLIISL
jgi:hypothetical protein